MLAYALHSQSIFRVHFNIMAYDLCWMLFVIHEFQLRYHFELQWHRVSLHFLRNFFKLFLIYSWSFVPTLLAATQFGTRFFAFNLKSDDSIMCCVNYTLQQIQIQTQIIKRYDNSWTRFFPCGIYGIFLDFLNSAPVCQSIGRIFFNCNNILIFGKQTYVVFFFNCKLLLNLLHTMPILRLHLDSKNA